MRKKDFKCGFCKRLVSNSINIGTSHRNHCPYCLFSIHLDIKKGDRKSSCKKLMQPIGLTFKMEGKKDKYSKERLGEIMIIHECIKCDKISINRIAGDDNPESILKIFKKSQEIKDNKRKKLLEKKIYPLGLRDKDEVFSQLFGSKPKKSD